VVFRAVVFRAVVFRAVVFLRAAGFFVARFTVRAADLAAVAGFFLVVLALVVRDVRFLVAAFFTPAMSFSPRGDGGLNSVPANQTLSARHR
jgi:hypothetical protein